MHVVAGFVCFSDRPADVTDMMLLSSRPGQFQKWLWFFVFFPFFFFFCFFFCQSRLAATTSYTRVDKSLDRLWIGISTLLVIRHM